MKRSYILFLLATLLAPLLLACSSDKEEPGIELVGMWKLIEAFPTPKEGEAHYLVLAPNKTYTYINKTSLKLNKPQGTFWIPEDKEGQNMNFSGLFLHRYGEEKASLYRYSLFENGQKLRLEYIDPYGGCIVGYYSTYQRVR